MMIINYVIYYLTRWIFFFQLTHTADDAKAKHMSQAQEDKWKNIIKSCVYLQFKMFHREASVETIKLINHIFMNVNIKIVNKWKSVNNY